MQKITLLDMIDIMMLNKIENDIITLITVQAKDVAIYYNIPSKKIKFNINLKNNCVISLSEETDNLFEIYDYEEILNKVHGKDFAKIQMLYRNAATLLKTITYKLSFKKYIKKCTCNINDLILNGCNCHV